ncbi:polyhydroxybutyrate depolymerase [Paracoccus onubensis]|uniref:Polyhydroxybutyrate depolymerase n=2 Tax=Paracoccus onubensis TaxID=1675788 RepID=A0A418SM29_9RHOB|nr:polyhydroxybutyrate depolymerase [Paracoccus onubensis]
MGGCMTICFRAMLLFMLAGLLPDAAHAECADSAEPCRLEGGREDGTYHLVLPDEESVPDGLPAVIFLHGWGSDGASVMQNRELVDALVGRGYAVIAPDGSPRPERNGRSWQFHPERRDGRDEAAFLRAVADDAAKRFGLDRERMLLGGFSIGGSMVSYVACESPESFSAYAPVAGSFWDPLPDSCKAPVRLYHTHGWSDGTVPLEGRAVGNGQMVQGDVFAAMRIWRATNGCGGENPSGFRQSGDFLIRNWDCDSAFPLTFALHPGGHIVPQGWAGLVLDWYEASAR